MKKRIHIFGASGSGTSTLGRELTKCLPHTNLDTDDYYWADKFTQANEPAERLKRLKVDLQKEKEWILSGALCGWGNELKPIFDLVIFLYVPQEIRLERLRKREYQRYGDKILLGGSMYQQSKEFLEWAALYDHGGLEVRSKALHQHWMAELTCPILKIEGEQSVKERVEIVLDYLDSSGNKSIAD